MKYKKRSWNKWKGSGALVIYRNVFVRLSGNNISFSPWVGMTDAGEAWEEIPNRKRVVNNAWKDTYRYYHIDWRGVEE